MSQLCARRLFQVAQPRSAISSLGTRLFSSAEEERDVMEYDVLV